jgi:bla regulator protein BlaR1
MLPVILRIAASNALSAVVLAAVVATVSLLTARPALARALWVLVLLKLLLPPLWSIPIDGLFAPQPTSADGGRAPAVPEDGLASVDDFSNIERDNSGGSTDDDKSTSRFHASGESVAAASANGSSLLNFIPAAEWVAAAWIAGTLCGLIALVARVRQFLPSLRHAALAPAQVQRRCSALATQLGLRQSPGVWFGRTSFCPSLWAFSRPARVLVPKQLWDRLEATQQDALLVHELAHLRRRDHWVRLLEVAATLVYWWHPVVWYARRRLHEAEEQCCDAWVLGVLPSAGNSYAAALLETVDFISTAHPATPALASGMGEFSRLKRRIVMIQNGSVRKALTWTGATIVFGLACIVLPVSPGFGQDDPAKGKPIPDTKAIQAEVEKAHAGSADAAQAEAAKYDVKELIIQADGRTQPAELDVEAKANAEMSINQAKAKVQQLSAELQRIQATLAQANARLHALEAAQSDNSEVLGIGSTAVDSDKAANDYNRRLGLKLDEGSRTDTNDPRRRADRLDQLERDVKRILGEIQEMKGERSGQPKK